VAARSVKCIAVVGAESTGKTSLIQALAQQVPSLVVPESLRDFVDRTGRTPTQDEQILIMQSQIDTELLAKQQASDMGPEVVWCDTSAIMTAVYSEFYFGDESLYPAALAHHQMFAMTLFCQPDVSWVADPGQRDGPEARAAIHALLAERLQSVLAPVVPIVGEGDSRVRLALRAIAALH
jgi:nicotinamide riboside kinase